jgi:hypothetical protein
MLRSARNDMSADFYREIAAFARKILIVKNRAAKPRPSVFTSAPSTTEQGKQQPAPTPTPNCNSIGHPLLIRYCWIGTRYSVLKVLSLLNLVPAEFVATIRK